MSLLKKKETFRKIDPQQEVAEGETTNQQVEQSSQLQTSKQKQKTNRFIAIDNDRSFDVVNQNIIWNSQILLEMANEMYS